MTKPVSRPLLTFGATVNSFAYAIIVFALGVLLPSLSAKLRLSETQKGSLFLVQNLAILLPILASGPLLDRLGRKPVLIAGASLVTVATLGIGYVPSYVMLLSLLFLLGLGGGLTNIANNTLISDLYPENPGRALNWVNSAYGAGAIAIPLFYSLAGVYLGVQLYMTLLALLPAIPLVVFVVGRFPGLVHVERIDPGRILRTLASPLVFYLGAVLFFYVALEVSTAGWLKTYYIETFGLTDRTSGFVLTGFSVMLMLGRLVAALVLERVRGTVLLIWTSLLACVGLALMVLSGSLAVSVAGVLITGLAYAPVFPTTLGTVGEEFATYRATVMGVVMAIGFLGPTTVPFLIGVLERNMTVMIVAAVLMFVSQLLVWRNVSRARRRG